MTNLRELLRLANADLQYRPMVIEILNYLSELEARVFQLETRPSTEDLRTKVLVSDGRIIGFPQPWLEPEQCPTPSCTQSPEPPVGEAPSQDTQTPTPSYSYSPLGQSILQPVCGTVHTCYPAKDC